MSNTEKLIARVGVAESEAAGLRDEVEILRAQLDRQLLLTVMERHRTEHQIEINARHRARLSDLLDLDPEESARAYAEGRRRAREQSR